MALATRRCRYETSRRTRVVAAALEFMGNFPMNGRFPKSRWTATRRKTFAWAICRAGSNDRLLTNRKIRAEPKGTLFGVKPRSGGLKPTSISSRRMNSNTPAMGGCGDFHQRRFIRKNLQSCWEILRHEIIEKDYPYRRTFGILPGAVLPDDCLSSSS